MTVNRYTKLIKTLKESPTNSMGGVYSLNPQGFDLRKADVAKKFYPGIDGNFPNGIPGSEGDPFYLRPAGFWDGGDDWESYEISDGSQDYLLEDPTGKSTSGLIADDGSVKAALPPNSRHFILGPLVDGYVPNHGYDNFTNIGYLQKDTRQFVLLARIQGQFTADLHSEGARVWDGTEGQLTIINSNFTLEMAEWFRDQIIAGSFTPNVPYFYSGGVPQQPQTPATCPNCPPNMFGGVGPGTTRQFGTGKLPTLGTQYTNPTPDSGDQLKANIFNLTPDQQQAVMGALMLGLDIAAVIAFLFPEPSSTAAGAAHLATKFRYAAKVGQALNKFNPFKTAARAKSWWNRVRNTRIPNENLAKFGNPLEYFKKNPNPKTLFGDDALQRGMSDAAFKSGKTPRGFGRPDQAFNPFRSASKGGPGSGPTPAVRQAFERPVRALRDNPRTAATAAATATAAAGRPARGQVDKKYLDKSGNIDVKKMDDLFRNNPDEFQRQIQRGLKKPQEVFYDKEPAKVDKKVSSEIDNLIKKGKGLKPGSSAANINNNRLIKQLDKLPATDPRYDVILKQITGNTRRGAKPAKRVSDRPAYFSRPFKIGEEFNYQTLLETAPTGSGPAGGTEVADAYVDTVSQDASPDQLDQAANDANDIATQGGQGLSDSDLEQIDNQAEQDARELFKRMDNPNSMSTEQIRSAVTEIYNSNSEWLYGAFDQYESLIPDDAEFDRIEQEHENKKIELQTNIDNIKLEIKEIDDQYSGGAYGSFNYKGIRVHTDKNWGSQFTPQNFESSGQSWEDYSALRAKLGFLNGNSGPTEYGRYLPIGWRAILNAKENGHTSANFSGIAKEIVAKGEELDAITSHPNFPQPGRNIYYTEADYLEAVELQNKAGKVFAEYKNLWEGPGGYDDIYDQMWGYDRRSKEMQTELAYAAALRKQELQSELENIDTEISDDALYEQWDALMRPFYNAIIKDWNTFVNLFNVMTADAYDNYNWLWKNYGLPAAEWYIKNQKKPMKSNPFIPAGAYIPLALENPLETDPFSLKDLTPTSISSMSEAEKKKLIRQLIAQGLVNPDGSIKAHAVSDDVTSDMIRGLEQMIKDSGPTAPMPMEPSDTDGYNMPMPPADELLDPDRTDEILAQVTSGENLLPPGIKDILDKGRNTPARTGTSAGQRERNEIIKYLNSPEGRDLQKDNPDTFDQLTNIIILSKQSGDESGGDSTDIATDARNPMGTGDQAIAGAGALIGNPAVQAAAAQGLAALAAFVGSMGLAKQIMNQINKNSDPYGQDQAGPTTTGKPVSGAVDLTPEQQAAVEAAGKELRDAEREYGEIRSNPDATDIQKEMAKERVDRARKNRQRLRRKHREENKNRKESYVPKFLDKRDRILTESKNPNQRRILREIRQPVEIKKAPSKYKINFTNKNTFSSQTDELVSKANARGQQWRDENKRWSGYETTEKDNIIQDRVGHGKQAWEYMLDEGTKKSEWRTKEVQEELNKIAHEKAMLKENPDFKSPFGNVEVTTTEKNIKNFEKVNRIKKVVVDKKVFSNKEIKPEYPEDDKMSKAYSMPDVLDQEKSPFGKGEVQNPEFGKIEFEHEKLKSGERASAYYKRLDPISAKSMPDAAYPQIDDLKNQARKKPK